MTPAHAALLARAQAHEHRLVDRHASGRAVHGGHWFGRLNQRLSLLIGTAVGTMVCAYVFTILALLSFPAAIRSGNLVIIIGWLSSNFLQLVLLPVIIVSQNVAAAGDQARAEADHETLVLLHQLLTVNTERTVATHDGMRLQDAMLARILQHLDPAAAPPPLVAGGDHG